MNTAELVVLVVVVVAVVLLVVGLTTLYVWWDDRRDQRRYLGDQGRWWGPDGSRAAGDAWSSIAGDGPPAMRLRTRGVSAETGVERRDPLAAVEQADQPAVSSPAVPRAAPIASHSGSASRPSSTRGNAAK